MVGRGSKAGKRGKRVSRLSDKSVEGYKAFITKLSSSLNSATGETSEEQWVEAHKEFWGKSAKPKKRRARPK